MGIFVHIWKHISSIARHWDAERTLNTISSLQFIFKVIIETLEQGVKYVQS